MEIIIMMALPKLPFRLEVATSGRFRIRATVTVNT